MIPWLNNWTASYQANLEAMASETEKYHIPFVIVPQIMDYPPAVFEVLANGFDEDSKQQLTTLLTMRHDHWHFFLRQMDAVGIQAGVAHSHDNVMMVDLHKDFFTAQRTGGRLFFDNVHLTPDGNKVIARSLAFQIRTRFALPHG